MATTGEKPGLSREIAESDRSHDLTHEEAAQIARPKSWKYKSFRIGSINIPWYASPPTQLLIVSFVCFLCPGMFNALAGMGGGGQVDHKTGDDANTALYATFAVVGFFAGTFTNKLGIRTALSIGGLGYCIYIASFLCFNNTSCKNYGFAVFSGALLGVCAGLLWTAQGTIMMSYPPEESKGKYIGWFWMIFNLGAVIGSLIPLGQNIHVTENRSVTNGTYIGFLVLTIIGAALAWCLVDAKSVIRADGSRVIVMKNPTWKTELLGLWETFQTDPYILLLFPMFFSSNWFYTYQFNAVNGAYFTTRTKALNNTLYYLMQIAGAFVFGYALDRPNVRRTVRAKACWVALLVLTMVIWGGGFAFQKRYTRKDTTSDDFVHMDWTHSGYVGPMFLYMFYGFYDAAWQTSVYWFMGALTNNGRKLANFAGFYKGIQSAGAAIVWSMDSNKLPYMNIFGSCWGLLTASLLAGLPVILWKVRDHVPIEEDLKFSDETLEDVAAPGALKHERASVPEKS